MYSVSNQLSERGYPFHSYWCGHFRPNYRDGLSTLELLVCLYHGIKLKKIRYKSIDVSYLIHKNLLSVCDVDDKHYEISDLIIISWCLSLLLRPSPLKITHNGLFLASALNLALIITSYPSFSNSFSPSFSLPPTLSLSVSVSLSLCLSLSLSLYLSISLFL